MYMYLWVTLWKIYIVVAIFGLAIFRKKFLFFLIDGKSSKPRKNTNNVKKSYFLPIYSDNIGLKLKNLVVHS